VTDVADKANTADAEHNNLDYVEEANEVN